MLNGGQPGDDFVGFPLDAGENNQYELSGIPARPLGKPDPDRGIADLRGIQRVYDVNVALRTFLKCQPYSSGKDIHLTLDNVYSILTGVDN